MLLKNKVAVVTGSAAGIGEGITRLFAAEGAELLLLDCDQARNKTLERSLNGDALALTCDVTSRAEVACAIHAAMERWGRVDILINNAGRYPRQPFLQMSEEQWDEIQAVNLKSVFHTTQCVLPHMVERMHGKIVNISSVGFHVGMAHLTHYSAAKGGIIGFTRSLAREMGAHGICVNAITPGAVLVEAEKVVATDAQVQAIIELQSIKRRVLPLDIARACLFLSTEWSDGMTGQTLNVDGGWVMH